MNVEIRTEAAQFLFWEYINSNFFAVQPWPLSMIIYLPFIKKNCQAYCKCKLTSNSLICFKIKTIKNVVVVWFDSGVCWQYDVLIDYGFIWDSSIPVPPLTTPVWPYTLDYKWAFFSFLCLNLGVFSILCAQCFGFGKKNREVHLQFSHEVFWPRGPGDFPKVYITKNHVVLIARIKTNKIGQLVLWVITMHTEEFF